jgi:hypothetical protein
MLRKFLSTHYLSLILLISGVNGLIYLFALPPWQHYDEPSHVEYAWLIANRGSLPKPEDYDQNMRREFVKSMSRHAFYKPGQPPQLIEQDAPPIQIGLSQLDDPPTYYLYAAVPMGLTRNMPLVIQVRVARFASWLLFLLTIVAASGVARELAPKSRSLQIATPLVLGLLPSYVDSMTSVNNDVGANAVFGLFLWGCARLFNPDKPNTFRRWMVSVVWVVLAAILCYSIKRTGAIALPLGVIAILLSIQGVSKWMVRIVLIVVVLGIAASGFTLSMPSQWYGRLQPKPPVVVEHEGATHGQRVFRLQPTEDQSPAVLTQIVYLRRGSSLTFGAWMWSDRMDAIGTLSINDLRGGIVSQTFEITSQPAFKQIAYVAERDDIHYVSLGNPDAQTLVFFDGVVMIEGAGDRTSPPIFDEDLTSGKWGGANFSNLIRNPSAEARWIGLSPIARSFADRLFPYPYSWLIFSVNDSATGWYYERTLESMFRSFWGVFSWGQVSLAQHWFLFLAAFTLAAVIGGMVALRRGININATIVFGLAIALSFGLTLTRGLTIFLGSMIFIPGMRYSFVVAIPIVLVLCVGWREWARMIAKRTSREISPIQGIALLSALLLGLNAIALRWIVTYYTLRGAY